MEGTFLWLRMSVYIGYVFSNNKRNGSLKNVFTSNSVINLRLYEMLINNVWMEKCDEFEWQKETCLTLHSHMEFINRLILFGVRRNASGTTCAENQNIIFYQWCLFENRAVYETMWQNIVERNRTRVRIACWLHKVTNTLRLYNIHCSSTATMVARTRLNITLYLLCLSCF